VGLFEFGWKAYSQNDEDGIIQEIFRRIGVQSATFVEIGIGDGLENNTLNLLSNGWSGHWFDLNKRSFREFRSKGIGPYLDSMQLKAALRRVSRENVNQIFFEAKIPAEVDLLSVDIDGEDFWVWKNLTVCRPRVVVIEYNATVRPPSRLIAKQDSMQGWNGSNYFGASLAALEILGNEKGYKLVSCNIAGCNAFFVRDDLIASHFSPPFTAEYHYEPARYYLKFYSGHRPHAGLWEKPPPISTGELPFGGKARP
jgi:hypothetical protein